ncbi:MAG: trimethylamine methyltransferase family protein, partial [Candidatus Heimdallarchaeota archaeon]|nr:trimethylamine methyltransferase family protein [Candidatus Heimdallarchaeota archaeon]
LESDHTLAHIKEEWSPHLIDRQNFEMWFEGGATTMRSRARAIIDEILKEDPTSKLAPETEKKINAISKKILESNGG